MSNNHLFREFHEDEKIGHLMWRMSRRQDAMSDSQDGVHIAEQECNQTSDREQLNKLLKAYNSRPNKEQTND